MRPRQCDSRDHVIAHEGNQLAMMRGLAPAIFFDKDGTLIEDRPYNVDPRLIEFATGAEAALRALHRRGFRFIVITNQAGVAQGYFPESSLGAVEDKLRMMMRAAGTDLEAFYYCPHHPDGKIEIYKSHCDCRKPAPGMILRAARERGVDLARSWFIGDILNDVEAGRRAGCRTILIDNGNETEWLLTSDRVPHHLAPDLWEAARFILNAKQQEEEKDVHLEGLEKDSLRSFGFDGRRLDDGTRDLSVEGVQS